MSGLWFVIAAAIGLVGVLVESISLVVVAVVALLTAVVSLFAGQHAAVPTKSSAARKTTSVGGNPRKRSAPPKPGTAAKGQKCGAACRWSKKPVDRCTCSCGGRSHGSEVGRAFAGSRAEVSLKSRQNLKKNREAAKRERA